ncbi:MAG: hypothetical protein HYT41_01180 [Candidatus Sungbacteria bacterium]|nr:hypothetical protein [Candidatus Sungbacteria bacterium]
MQYLRKPAVIGAFAGLFLASSAHAAVLAPVPFTSQAPSGDWREPFQNFCEEASVVMAVHTVWGVRLTPEIAELEMRLIQRYEDLVFGRSKDNSIEEMAAVLRTLYGFKGVETRVIRSSDEIKDELRQGAIAIAPAAGRLLKNPYFRAPGPLYHMLVIRGFDDVDGSFVTNDPGTRRGNGLRYPQARLFDAIHDWNGGDVLHGEKRIMIVRPAFKL